jgi:hypothetical protein
VKVLGDVEYLVEQGVKQHLEDVLLGDVEYLVEQRVD